MAPEQEDITRISSDPVAQLLLSGKAETLSQAEEMYLDSCLPEVIRLLQTGWPKRDSSPALSPSRGIAGDRGHFAAFSLATCLRAKTAEAKRSQLLPLLLLPDPRDMLPHRCVG